MVKEKSDRAMVKYLDSLDAKQIRLLRDNCAIGILRDMIREHLSNLIEESKVYDVSEELLILSNMYSLTEELRCLLEERARL